MTKQENKKTRKYQQQLELELKLMENETKTVRRESVCMRERKKARTEKKK